MKSLSHRSLLICALAAVLPAQTLSVSTWVDPVLKTTTLKFDAKGSGAGTCSVFGASSLMKGLPLSIGTLYLDPATLTPLFSFPLNSVGVGSLVLTFPAATLAGLQIDLQAVVSSGTSLALTGYVMLAQYASYTLSEILVADYHSGADFMHVNGKGRNPDLIEGWRKNPGSGWVRLFSWTVPLAMMSIGAPALGFEPTGEIEVRILGTIVIMKLK